MPGKQNATPCLTTGSQEVGDEGLEHLQESSGKTHILNRGGAESGALDALSAPGEADLRAVVAAWPDLGKGSKAEIMAVVRAGVPVVD